MSLVSLIVSIISVVTAFVAVIYAKQNAIAAVRSARAGEQSAHEAALSREVAETATVHGARQKTLEGAPNFYFVLEQNSPVATLETTTFADDVSEVACTTLTEGMRITKEAHDFRSIYFDIYGVMQNRDSDPVFMAVAGGKVTLVEGESSLCGGPYALPLRDARGRYILEPGKAVRFRWRVEAGFDRWIDIARGVAKDWGPIDWVSMEVLVFHILRVEGADDPILRIKATAAHSPVYVNHEKGDTLIAVSPGEELDDCFVQAKLLAHMPKSVEDLKPKR